MNYRFWLALVCVSAAMFMGCGGSDVHSAPATPDRSGDNNPSILPGDAGEPSCRADVPCLPENSCMLGVTVCASPYSAPVCEARNAKADGVDCDNGKVCSSGACVPKTCHEGDACQPSDPCHTGSIVCESATKPGLCSIGSIKSDGTACGSGLVCSSGACIGAPRIVSFSASPQEIVAGNSATLTVNAEGATEISIDNGIGTVSGHTVTVHPAATTTYTLTAKNIAGSTKAKVTVTVKSAVQEAAKVTATVNTHLMVADGSSHPTFTVAVFDASGNAMPGYSWKLLVNGREVSSPFTTTVPGSYEFVVQAGNAQSEKMMVMARENKQYPVVELPIIFHVEPGVSAEDVNVIFKRLNDAFGNALGSNDPNAVSLNIRFRLARKAPDGSMLSEAGIHHVETAPYDTGGSASDDIAGDGMMGANEVERLMAATYWNPRQYMNIWVISKRLHESTASSPLLLAGYNLPGVQTTSVVLEPDAGYYGAFALDRSDALNAVAHEMGHRFGLLHVFSSGNNCSATDYCHDTYSYEYNTKAECGDNQGTVTADNEMDYSATRRFFSYDQRERARYVLEHGLWISELANSPM